MAFANGLRSPQIESSCPTNYTPPIRPIGSQFSSNATSSSAERVQLHRRFTTNALPTLPTLSPFGPLSPINQQRRQAIEPPSDLAAATLQKIQLLQRRKEEYELLTEQRSRYQTALETFDASNLNELQRLESDIRKLSMGGHQSEPTTPPEYRDVGLVHGNRANRLSLASMTSAQGIGSIVSPRTTRSGSQTVNTSFSHSTANNLPSFSVPQSRRGSDEEVDGFSGLDFTVVSRRPNGFNRNSMPAMSSATFDFSKNVNSVLGINNLMSLLADEDDDGVPGYSRNGLIDGSKHLHMETNGEGFPLLRRREIDVDQDDRQAAAFSSIHRHRPGQQSLPWNTLCRSQHEEIDEKVFASPGQKANASNRRSMDVYLNASTAQSKRSSVLSVTNGFSNNVPKLQQSYSTNDIPTMKNTNLQEPRTGLGVNMTHAEQHLHKHNAALRRLPPTASNRHSRDLAAFDSCVDETTSFQSSSALQANAPTFQNPPAQYNNSLRASSFGPTITSTNVPNKGFYNNYNMPMVNATNYAGNSDAWNVNSNAYSSHEQNYNGFGSSYPRPPFPVHDSHRANMKSRKGEDDSTRFAHYNIETLVGQLYDLCKDQHGCRYLQRKIEEGNLVYIAMIFKETKDHIVDLMTDPFGNYLSQKLLEYCNDEQRTTLINNAAPDMIGIALNSHGTRALQKMIEFISTTEQVRRIDAPTMDPAVNRYQIETIKHALSTDIVGLIHDLNGNHVIQKCLNHLKPEDAIFIFDEVARNCLIVGSHRHGCCVLQRCIDHAVNGQKTMLIQSVITNAFDLVQDPFGNYVVQYILDLGVPEFTRPLCLSFKGRMVDLSRQKFSSNVMEKMIRSSPIDIRHEICMEYMVSPSEVERHIRDMYTNYVVQTILDFGPPDTVEYMWTLIRQIIDRVRATPAGRRINNKLQAYQAGIGQEIQPPMRTVNGGFYHNQNLGWIAQEAQLHSNQQQPAFF